jgi:hypothetical protein
MKHIYKLADCDIPLERHRELESFRGKMELWSSWLDGDKDHAIWDTLASITWRDVCFRYLRQIAIDNDNSALYNSLLMEALLNGYVATQVLAIRRLNEDAKNVISLRRLLKDLKSNIDLFTRENYVCYDGLPYDYETVLQKDLMTRGPGTFWGETKGPKAHGISRLVHTHFDKLASIEPKNRTREDRLPTSLLNTIEKWLNDSGAKELADWSHAYLAHAGSPESRKAFAEFNVTMDKIANTTKALARVTEAISGEFLYIGGRTHGLIPTAQFTPFERLDMPVMKFSPAEAWKLWHQLSDEQNRYLEGVDAELLSQTTSPKNYTPLGN